MADFGLLTIASDATNPTSSNSFRQGGTFRWMSPELFDPEKFGLKDSRRTKRSDCYALGMVIYEVLRRRVPFHQHADFAVVVRVGKGERPGRPQEEEGVWFVDDIWSMLERCWKPNPGDRPSIEDILQCLGRVSRSWTPPSPQTAAGPPMTKSPASVEESTDESEMSSPSQVVLPRSSNELPQTGEPNKTNTYVSAHEFPALPDAHGIPHYQDFRTGKMNPSRVNSEEPVGVLDRVSWVGVLDDH